MLHFKWAKGLDSNIMYVGSHIVDYNNVQNIGLT